MNKDFKLAMADLLDFNEEQCRWAAERSLRLLAAFTDSVDECCSQDTVSKVVQRWKALLGREE